MTQPLSGATRRRLQGVPLLALLLIAAACGDSPPTTPTTTTTTLPSQSGPLVPDSTLTYWPNAESRANSDPWLMRNHPRLTVLRPKVLALNFVNARSMDDMAAHFQALIAALRTGSRYHGYKDPSAQPMLEYSILKSIDLRDHPAPAGFPYRNSSRYPRESPVDGYFGLDYGRFFSREFAEYYEIRDPGDGHRMDLCELVNAGIIHELWLYADDVLGENDVSYAEVLELKPWYDVQRRRIGNGLDPCAGNGCFDSEDVASLPNHCTRTVRILWVNDDRGIGCGLENFDHGFEHTANSGLIPYLRGPFREFADFDLDQRYGTPFDSWYSCDARMGNGCITYTGLQSLDYDTGAARGSISNYQPVCGQSHVPPNGRGHYDFWGDSPAVTLSTCEHFRLLDGPDRKDKAERFDSRKFIPFNGPNLDCGEGWHVWWRQNFPGPGSGAKADDGSLMLSWWPFLFY